MGRIALYPWLDQKAQQAHALHFTQLDVICTDTKNIKFQALRSFPYAFSETTA